MRGDFLAQTKCMFMGEIITCIDYSCEQKCLVYCGRIGIW